MYENNIDNCDDDLPTLSGPSEVLEHIFGFLDAKTFCICRQVCKTWGEIIKIMQRKQSVWKQFCLREIPERVLEETLWFKSCTLNDIDWMNIYKKWYSGRMILKSPRWKRNITALHENPVTCLRVSGKWIITGHSNGLLCIWNMLTGNLCQTFMCHLKVITDMALVDLLNLETYYGYDEIPWSHHHIITISKDRYIHVLSLLEPMISTDSDVHINYHTDDLKQIRVFEDKFAVSCCDNTVTLWNMKVEMLPYFHLKVTLLRKIVGPMDYILCLGLWHDKVSCLSHGGQLREFQPNEGEWVSKMQYIRTFPDDSAGYIIGSAHFFRKNTIVMVSGNGQIIISEGLKSPIQGYLMPHLRTDITSVALYGTIFALGGENGKLFLYHVPNEAQLMCVDISKPDCTMSLSEASIIAIDISYQQDTPVIVACSNDAVYAIKWSNDRDGRKATVHL